MRKSKRDKKVKKVFNATTEKMKELITNENDLKIFMYYFNAEHNQFSERVAGIMASVSLGLLAKKTEERKLLMALAKKQINEILPEMKEAAKPPASLVVLTNLFELNELLEEILAWIPKGVARLIKYNKPFVDVKQLEILEEKRLRVLDSLKVTIDFCDEVKQVEPIQVNIFREMMSRILMIRYELRHSLENEIKDKKDIRYIKTLMTKLEKLFSWQYNLIETGDDGCE